MEWLILLLLVPAILVPVVLLFGFAGCHFRPAPVQGTDPPPPAVMPPTVTAEPKNIDHIVVSWQNTDPNPATNYHFVRLKGAVTETDTQLPASPTTVDDTGLDVATVYTYQVSTITAAGTSDPTALTTSTFQPTFQADPAATSQPGFAGDFCYVQRITAGKLLASGGKVGIRVRGATPAANHQNVTINSIYISRVAATGNPWDSASDLTPVMTSPLVLQADEIKDLDPVAYNLDESQDLLVAFDFTATANADTIRVVVPQAGVTSYFKAGVQQASVQTRQPGYSTGNSQIYLVVTIGVP